MFTGQQSDKDHWIFEHKKIFLDKNAAPFLIMVVSDCEKGTPFTMCENFVIYFFN